MKKNYPSFPIYIASKGRPECPTAKLLDESGLDFQIWVEPQDYESYLVTWPKQTVSLEKNDRGLMYVRQAVLDAEREKHRWFWMMDDDITGFFITSRRKCERFNAEVVLSMAENRIYSDGRHCAQASLEYRQFAWSAVSEIAENSYCDVCVCIHSSRSVGVDFDQTLAFKGDRNFTLQLLCMGWDTMRLRKLSFSCPKNGSNAGGLSGVYAKEGVEKSSSEEMERRWGRDICRYKKKKDGRPDVAVNWKYFKKNKEAIAR